MDPCQGSNGFSEPLVAIDIKSEPERTAHTLSVAPRAPRWDDVLEEASQAPTLLIVDEIDLNRRLLRAMLKTAPYHIVEARRPSEAFAILEREKVDLVIVDQVMPEMSGPEFCQVLKNDRRTQLVPLLMTTSVQGMENEVAGYESGADEFLIKPLRPALVRTRIR